MYGDLTPNVLMGSVRKTDVPAYGSGEQRLGINGRGESLAVQAMPLKSELVRLGQSWSITTPAANHFAPIAALPTTRAEMVLYNGEPSNGKSYLIDSVFAVADTSIAAAGVITLLGQLVASGAAPTDNTAVLVNSRSGRAAYGGRAKKAIANTAYGIADKWEVLGNSSLSSATTTIGLAAYAEVYGGFIVPPGGLFLANLIAGTAAGTIVIGVVWHEAVIDLG